MAYVSEIHSHPPKAFTTPLQAKVFERLAMLNIPYERVSTDEVITMEDCAEINAKLHMKMVKTLFLCDRKQSTFFLFITCGDKPFRAKDFSNALGVPRLSFAPANLMEEMLGTAIGAATIFSMLLEEASAVRLIIDKDVINEAWYGCSDGTTTGYLKASTKDIMNVFLPSVGCRPQMIDV